MRIACFILAAAVLSPLGAAANPDGAPWSSSNPKGVIHCASCHFGGDTEQDSSAIALEGLPDELTPGEIYELVLTFANPSDAAIVGFLASASAGAYQDAGEGVESRGKEVRSTEPVDGKAARWALQWRAPESDSQSVKFLIGVNAANDDQSAFGDEIHYKTIALEAGE